MSYARCFPNVSQHADSIQRRTPGLSLEEAQFESAVEHRLEGPQAVARERPHIAHVLEKGPHAPLRAALDRRFILESGPSRSLIQRKGINPALIHHNRRRK